jgi:hypothetical protein
MKIVRPIFVSWKRMRKIIEGRRKPIQQPDVTRLSAVKRIAAEAALATNAAKRTAQQHSTIKEQYSVGR